MRDQDRCCIMRERKLHGGKISADHIYAQEHMKYDRSNRFKTLKIIIKKLKIKS